MKKYFVILGLIFSCFLSAQKSDSLRLEFPKKYNLKLEAKQENSKMKMLEWIPKGKNWDNYDIIATMITLKDGAKIPLELLKQNQYKIAVEKTEGLKLTDLEKNKEGEREYILFKMEAKSYKNSPNTESQLFYFTKAENDLFICISALRTESLSKEFVDEWTKVFKESQIIP